MYAIPLYDGGVRTAMNMESTNNFAPLGLGARLEYLGAKFSWGLLGFGASVAYNYIQDRREDIEATVTAHFFSVAFFIDSKFDINDNIALYAHAGGGMFLVPQPQYQYDDGYIPPSENWGYPEYMIGGVVQYKFTEVLSAEAGVDFVNTIGLHVPFPCVLFSLGIGWRLL